MAVLAIEIATGEFRAVHARAVVLATGGAGRVFRQNTIVVCRNARPELTVTDPTCGDVGKAYVGNWRVRT